MSEQNWEPFEDTEVDGLDPQEALQRQYNPETDVDHVPNQGA